MSDLTTLSEQLLKPTATIHIGNPLSLIERRTFNAIIWHLQKHRRATGSGSMSMDFLMSLIGLERSKNTTVVKEALERLTTTPITWNTLKKDRTSEWGVCTFLAGAGITGGKVSFTLNPLLEDKVQNPTLFAKIQLLVQTQFSSKYSLALYEFFIDELGRAGNPKTHTIQVSLDTVRHVLQFDGVYKHLNNDVLKPCIREIHKFTDIAVGYQGVKKGRAVEAIRFSIERTAMQVQMPLDDLAVMEPRVQGALLHNPLQLMLVERGVAKRKAKELADSYSEERISENIAYAEHEYEAGKVKNLTAYLIRAIEEDYRPKKTPDEERREREQKEAEERKRQQEALEAEQGEWNRYRERKVRERFAALSSDEQEAWRTRFIDRLREESPLIYKQYKKEGFESRLVDAQFFAGLREALLVEQEELDFQAFRTGRTHKNNET